MIVERAVVDTNVLISSALTKGLSFQLVRHLIQQSKLLFSIETMDELSSRLKRGKFDPYLSVELREEFLEELSLTADWVTIEGKTQGCRDRDDDKFLETAVVGQADILITGDADLLSLHPFKGLPILTPAKCIKKLSL